MRRLVSRWICLATVFAGFLASSPLLQAQTPLVDRLSPETVFCVAWRGTTSLSGAEQKNHVLQLLQDPAFAPAWLGLVSAFQQRNQKAEGPTASLGLPDVTSLLENPFAFGASAVSNGEGSPGPNGQPSHFGFFIVYDATGKAGLIDKLKASNQRSEKAHSQVTTYDFGGTSVEVRAAGASVTYSAQTSHYFVASDQKQIIESLIRRFGSADGKVTSLGQLTPYRDLQKFIGSDAALEWYARIPDPDQWTMPPSGGRSAAQFAKSIHLEKIHAVGGGVSFAGEAMHIKGAVLGDTSPGGVFDLAGPSATTFQTEAVVNGSSTFSMSRFDLAALYALVRGAIGGTLSPQQVANVSAIETVGQSYLGMPVGDALGLMSGEIASFSTYSDDGTPQQLFCHDHTAAPGRSANPASRRRLDDSHRRFLRPHHFPGYRVSLQGPKNGDAAEEILLRRGHPADVSRCAAKSHAARDCPTAQFSRRRFARSRTFGQPGLFSNEVAPSRKTLRTERLGPHANSVG